MVKLVIKYCNGWIRTYRGATEEVVREKQAKFKLKYPELDPVAEELTEE